MSVDRHPPPRAGHRDHVAGPGQVAQPAHGVHRGDVRAEPLLERLTPHLGDGHFPELSGLAEREGASGRARNPLHDARPGATVGGEHEVGRLDLIGGQNLRLVADEGARAEATGLRQPDHVRADRLPREGIDPAGFDSDPPVDLLHGDGVGEHRGGERRATDVGRAGDQDPERHGPSWGSGLWMARLKHRNGMNAADASNSPLSRTLRTTRQHEHGEDQGTLRVRQRERPGQREQRHHGEDRGSDPTGLHDRGHPGAVQDLGVAVHRRDRDLLHRQADTDQLRHPAVGVFRSPHSTPRFAS